MIVISNTSPLLNLGCIGEVAILEKLFSEIQIPFAVQAEVEHLRSTSSRFSHVAMPSFTRTVPLQNKALALALSLELDRGEAEAIALAVESRADVL